MIRRTLSLHKITKIDPISSKIINLENLKKIFNLKKKHSFLNNSSI